MRTWRSENFFSSSRVKLREVVWLVCGDLVAREEVVDRVDLDSAVR